MEDRWTEISWSAVWLQENCQNSEGGHGGEKKKNGVETSGNKWKWHKPQMSFRGRALTINSLVASALFLHRPHFQQAALFSLVQYSKLGNRERITGVRFHC